MTKREIVQTIAKDLGLTQRQAQQQFEFLQEHPIIRPLSDYSLESLLQFRRERKHDERQTG